MDHPLMRPDPLGGLAPTPATSLFENLLTSQSPRGRPRPPRRYDGLVDRFWKDCHSARPSRSELTPPSTLGMAAC